MAELTYKKAGVNIDAADAFISKIQPLLKQTQGLEVLGSAGGFGGLFHPRWSRYRDPVLVASTDGVGTKLLLADALNKYDTIGIDLVAMCVDDVVCVGAQPLFFLDYIACGRLNGEKLHAVMKGISRGCRQVGCALIGGETAELPGMYEENAIDLAGFCVGIVSRNKIIDGKSCRAGDKIIGLASSGVHSNGFSLVRRIFTAEEMSGPLGKDLLKPTKIYADILLPLMRRYRIKAVAHITGGGFYDNIPRILPPGLGAHIAHGSWTIPAIFRRIQRRGNVEEEEMFRTFNMGVGMILVVDPRTVSGLMAKCGELKQKAWVIGDVVTGEGKVELTQS